MAENRRSDHRHVRVRVELFDALARGELTYNELLILMALARRASERNTDVWKGERRQLELLSGWDKSPSTLLRTLERVKEKGWIDYDAEQGQRAYKIRLTGLSLFEVNFVKTAPGNDEVMTKLTSSSSESDEVAEPATMRTGGASELRHEKGTSPPSLTSKSDLRREEDLLGGGDSGTSPSLSALSLSEDVLDPDVLEAVLRGREIRGEDTSADLSDEEIEFYGTASVDAIAERALAAATTTNAAGLSGGLGSTENVIGSAARERPEPRSKEVIP